MTATVTPGHRPEPTVELRRDPLAPEAELALACAKANAKIFRDAGYTVHAVEVLVHETPKRALAFGLTIGGAK